MGVDARKLCENCNEEYVVLDLLESAREPSAFDWARGVSVLFNQARELVRGGADPRGLPNDPPSIASVHDARRLVDGIAKWANGISNLGDWLTAAEVARGFGWFLNEGQRKKERPDSAKVFRLRLETNGKSGKNKRISRKSVMEYARRESKTWDEAVAKGD